MLTYLLVGENKQNDVAEFLLAEHLLQLLSSLPDTLAIVAVHHEDEALSILEVVAPERAVASASVVPMKAIVGARRNCTESYPGLQHPRQ